MKRAPLCDRCGAEPDWTRFTQVREIQLPQVSYVDTEGRDRYSPGQPYDVCDDCLRVVVKFLLKVDEQITQAVNA